MLLTITLDGREISTTDADMIVKVLQMLAEIDSNLPHILTGTGVMDIYPCDNCGSETPDVSEVAVPNYPGDISGTTMWYCFPCQDATGASKDPTTYGEIY